MDATIHIDGGARGNPGPAAYAVVLERPGQPAVEESGTLGTATNNVAEYTALVSALHLATELGLKTLDIFSDSELLVKQMASEYRVKHPDLQPLHKKASELRKGFAEVRITHVRREQNKRADALYNEALDGKKKAGAAPASPKAPAKAVADDRVRADALEVLRSAARAWADGATVPPEAVWEQLWSVLEDGGVLRKK
ncbi:ribonuclease HI family protein [Urbifossiella limnaea]|uniref:14.7 kDa ribonuclease H-like protein n=1 Tax=Urbifossiella limnaea TaxID=2528023 RepID=A0A517XMX4_9BACT|nr:ribonuclease HI family protein [Urbifossiella limnaea]QDU18851.1 14.7 kDa ribonuclease H-like protein [Urbifossiella limnaea]